MTLCKFLEENGIKCDKNACFNFEGKKAEYCGKHKLENMVNVNSKKCIHLDENGIKCDKIHSGRMHMDSGINFLL